MRKMACSKLSSQSSNIINTYSWILFADWATSQSCNIKQKYSLVELD
jgi:hypothetical protein